MWVMLRSALKQTFLAKTSIRENLERHLTEVRNGNNILASFYDTLPDIQVQHL